MLPVSPTGATSWTRTARVRDRARQGARQAVSQRQQADHRGGRAGPARPRVPPALRAEPAVLRGVHVRERPERGGALPLERHGAIPSSRTTLLSVPDPYGNHNGGNLVFGPDGRLYTTIGDGGSGGDPENRSQDMSSSSASSCASTCLAPGRLGDRRARASQRLAVLVRPRARATSGSATSGRETSRRSTSCPVAKAACSTSGGTSTRGRGASRTRRSGPGKLVQPVFEYTPRQRLLGHGRLRLSRACHPADRRPVLLRRLLLGRDLEPEARRRQGDRGAQGGDRGVRPRIVRRGKPQGSSTSCRTTARSTASPADAF